MSKEIYMKETVTTCLPQELSLVGAIDLPVGKIVPEQ